MLSECSDFVVLTSAFKMFPWRSLQKLP
uniref:Uncharacterized protein n=1 Tax=Anguilla anguilla TaxID=7936 RepID=A0A0E9VA15_ANGAN